jgi:hypothetical protein
MLVVDYRVLFGIAPALLSSDKFFCGDKFFSDFLCSLISLGNKF